MALTKEQRVLRARLANYSLQAKYDAKEITQPARDAFLERFEREVDPDGLLPLEERARRATAARTAHMLKLALKSSQARSKGKCHE